MGDVVRYLTHPQVRIDAAIPVPDWGLSDEGAARVEAAVDRWAFAGTVHVVSSAERKALETARPIAHALALDLEIREAMHENDRSATGFLPPDAFEAAADAFFAAPETSFKGWERAADAQARVLREAEAALAAAPAGDVLFVGHGAVGTLLYCAFAGRAIDRAYDQKGGGHVWAARRADRSILHHWRPLESFDSP